MRRLTRALLLCLALLSVLLIAVKLLHGGGRPYPGVAVGPGVASDGLQALVELDLPPGNVATSTTGRIFFNLHPFAAAHRLTDTFLFELVDGTPRPFPDRAAQPELAFVFGMTVDARGWLWLTAPAVLERERTRIMAYRLADGVRVVDRWLEPGVGRFGQDLRVSPDGRTLYLADTGAFALTRASLVVVDTETWSTRELLADAAALQPQGWTIRTARGPYRIGFGLLSFVVGLDGLALDADGTWLYLAAMSHDTLYRVRTADLADRTLTPAALVDRVEAVGSKPLSDGIAVAPDGRVVLTDVEHGGGLVLVDRAGRAEALARSPDIVWADGVVVTADGRAVFTDSAIPSYIDPLLRPPSPEALAAGRPYRLYAVRLP